MSHPDHEIDSNPSSNPHFESVLTQALASPSRRMVLRGGLGLAGLAVLPGCATLTSASGSQMASALGFASLDKSLLDDVVLPPGYRYTVLHATLGLLPNSGRSSRRLQVFVVRPSLAPRKVWLPQQD